MVASNPTLVPLGNCLSRAIRPVRESTMDLSMPEPAREPVGPDSPLRALPAQDGIEDRPFLVLERAADLRRHLLHDQGLVVLQGEQDGPLHPDSQRFDRRGRGDLGPWACLYGRRMRRPYGGLSRRGQGAKRKESTDRQRGATKSRGQMRDRHISFSQEWNDRRMGDYRC